MKDFVVAGVVTLVFYQLNRTNNWVMLSNLQFGLVFVGILLALSFMEKYNAHSLNPIKAIQDVTDNLLDNPLVHEAVGDKNGQAVDACYGVPFKVMRTQYGDRALLAGYNEHVEPYFQGGLDQATPDHAIYVECMEPTKGGLETQEVGVVKKPTPTPVAPQ